MTASQDCKISIFPKYHELSKELWLGFEAELETKTDTLADYYCRFDANIKSFNISQTTPTGLPPPEETWVV
jgi:hypothetical protein